MTFEHPFTLGSDPRKMPAGVYVMHTQEDVYQGAFDAIYLRTSVDFEVPQRNGRTVRIIRPDDLASALERDKRRVFNMIAPVEECEDEQTALDRYGITRVPVDVFHFGQYRYSNPRDALAAARRHEAQFPLPDRVS